MNQEEQIKARIKARIELAEFIKKEMSLKEGEDVRPYEIIYNVILKQIRKLLGEEAGAVEFEYLLLKDRTMWEHLAEDFNIETPNPRAHLVYNKDSFDISWMKEPLEQLEKERAIKLAVETLVKVLKEDPEYYYSWQANIAMQFYDEFMRQRNDSDESAEDIHSIANNAAKNFLNLLIR